MKFLIKIVLISSLVMISLSTNKMFNRSTALSKTSITNKLKEKLRLATSSQIQKNQEKSKQIEGKILLTESKLTDLQNKINTQNSKLKQEDDLYQQEKTVFDDFSKTVKSLEDQFSKFFEAEPTKKIKSNLNQMKDLQEKHKKLIINKNEISDKIGDTATSIKKNILKENENEAVNEKDEDINELDKLTNDLSEKTRLENKITSQIKELVNVNNIEENKALPIKNDLFHYLSNGLDSMLQNLEKEKLLIKNTKQNNKTLLDKTQQINEQVLAFRNILENEKNQGIAANLESFQKELLAIRKLNKEHNSNKKLILESIKNNKKLTKSEIHNLTFDLLKYKQIKRKETDEIKRLNEQNKIINVYADKLDSNIKLNDLEQKLDQFVGLPVNENKIAITIPENNDYYNVIKQASNQTESLVNNIDLVINKVENNYNGIKEKLDIESEKEKKIENELAKKENLLQKYETMINIKDNEINSKDKDLKSISKLAYKEKVKSEDYVSKIKAYKNEIEEQSKEIKSERTKLTKEEQDIRKNKKIINKLKSQIKAEENEISKDKQIIQNDNLENQKSKDKIKELQSQLEKMKQINNSLMQVNKNEKKTIVDLMNLETPSTSLSNNKVNNLQTPKPIKEIKKIKGKENGKGLVPKKLKRRRIIKRKKNKNKSKSKNKN